MAAEGGGREARRSTFAQMARRGEILFDRHPPPRVGGDLQPRQGGDPSAVSTLEVSTSTAVLSPSPSSLSTTTVAPSSGLTAASSSTAPSMTVASSTPYSPLPSPFDTSLGNNFTSASCPTFFQSFLSNSTFKSCLPFSLLLQNSNSFFTASKSVLRITQSLDATCNVALPTCSKLMNAFANQIRLDGNCGQDYKNQNPIVVLAYDGMVGYEPLYHAGCLKDSTGNYCFADAITNTSSPTDSYIYYLPLGINLPGGARPTCSECLSRTMSIFATAASNASQPISSKYVAAAQQIDLGCGPNFVNASIPATKSSAGRGVSPPPGVGWVNGLLALAVIWLVAIR
ncbi:hypothetical protein MMC16_002291 [Acarospora aff. strigata]|nr:hypothetical protein [Acarospora aff. strigata]